MLGDLPRLRAEVLGEVQALILDWQDWTLDWWRMLPPHLQKVYWHEDRQQITQIPVMVELLRRCSFPGLAELE